MAPATALPRSVRAVLRLGARFVPGPRRREWLREWTGELEHLRRRPVHDRELLGRSLNSLRDAVWLRTHEWSADMLLQDLRFALRTHLDRPGFAAIAILTLAIGVGATTALFSVVNAVLLGPLPYAEPDRLLRVYGFNDARGVTRINMNPLDLRDLRDRATTLDGLAWATSDSVTLAELDEPVRLQMDLVAASFFDLLGARAVAGRFFVPAEDDPDSARVVVLSHRLWQQQFGSDPDTIGRTLTLSGTPHEVIGVAPPGFPNPFHTVATDLWSTYPVDPDNRGGHFMRAIARLAPGVGLEAANEEIDAIGTAIAAEQTKPGRGLFAVSLKEAVVGDTRPALLLLLGAVAFVLLIVCANLAGLYLARATARDRELAVRVALGASRARIFRQLLSECLMLAAIGGTGGIALAALLVEAFGDRMNDLVATAPSVGLDWRVLLFASAVSLASGLLFGIVPAMRTTGRELGSLQEGHGVERRQRTTLRAALVVAEVALSLVLLIGAGLLMRSFVNLMTEEIGYDPAGVLTVRLSVPPDAYPAIAEVPTFYDRLREQIGAVPEVTSVGLINRLPLGGSYSCDGFHLEGWPPPEPGRFECAEERVVGGDYFATMGIRLIHGRWFDERDTADATEVVVISETMARRYFADREPLGAGFKWGSQDEQPYRRVVGIVADVKHTSLEDEPMAEVYMPQPQYPYYRTMYLAVRAEGDPQAALGGVRRALAAVDAEIPLFDVATMQERLGESVMARRVTLLTLGAFATVALLLATLGLYGVLAYMVSLRTREIGIRMALGATAGSVTGIVLRRGLILATAGVGLGTVAWLGVSGLLRNLVYRVGVADAATIAGTAALLLVLAAASSYLPALRATRVQPVDALRE